MMTPAFHLYKKKHPTEEIHLAIPKRYFPVFQHNPDVTLLDIEADGVQHYSYRKWFNFSDCPAARVESRTAPKVRKSRIDLFARGLRLGSYAINNMEKRPRYFVSDDERAFQQQFWKENNLDGTRVVGVQLHSDEVYRDYPHMKHLTMRLALEYRVLVFDTESIAGFQHDRITKVEGLPIRKAFALVAACDAIVAPDSAFVHLAAAFDIPTVALCGPVDGAIRTMHYPKCVYLDVREKLGCMPCWRNDKIPCKLTNMRASVCMTDIAVEDISSTLNRLLARS
jgi:ADP-heptose:LPS heptosyltransferase